MSVTRIVVRCHQLSGRSEVNDFTLPRPREDLSVTPSDQNPVELCDWPPITKSQPKTQGQLHGQKRVLLYSGYAARKPRLDAACCTVRLGGGVAAGSQARNIRLYYNLPNPLADSRACLFMRFETPPHPKCQLSKEADVSALADHNCDFVLDTHLYVQLNK